ncbi:HAMP domain-containing protein, partial [Nocardioides hankookensis]
GGESVLVQVLDADGTVLAASHSLEGEPALVAASGSTQPTRHVLSGLDDEEDRYLALVVTATDGRSVVAAQSLETVDNATRSTIGLLAVGDPLLVLLVALLTYVLVGRALRPVESLRAQAAEVTAADLSARLPVPTTGDEVERLSVTLNEMLARLETSVDAQRRFVADASHELRSPVATIRTLHEVAEVAGTGADWSSVSADVLAETER